MIFFGFAVSGGGDSGGSFFSSTTILSAARFFDNFLLLPSPSDVISPQRHCVTYVLMCAGPDSLMSCFAHHRLLRQLRMFIYAEYVGGAYFIVEVHRIWIWIRRDTNIFGSGKIQIWPDPNSLDPDNRIHYHVVVPITVSMHCVLSPNVRKVYL